MAGEQKGKAYEALTKLALEDLQAKGKFTGDIFWDEKPDGMTIMPDLTIGPDKDNPTVNLLITHSGSAKESEKKGWRNMGELVEAKVFLSNTPRVFNLAFDSLIKENLKKAQAATFDGQLIVGDLPYGNDLMMWIDTNLSGFPKDKDEKVEHLRALRKSDSDLRGLTQQFTKDLDKLLSKKAPKELEEVWQMERKRKRGNPPDAKETFVRRGLSKILVFEDLNLALDLYGGKRVRQVDVPHYAYDLNLAGKAIGRATPVDEEILNAVRTLGEPSVRSVVSQAPITKMEGWLKTLRNIPHLKLIGQYIIDEYENLIRPKVLEKRLIQLHKDPKALVSKYKLPKNWPPEDVWLFEYIVEVIKHDSGNAAGFGYAQLGREVVDAGHGTSSDLTSADQFGGGLGLSAWLRRNPTSGFKPTLLSGCANIFSGRLSQMGQTQCAALIVDIVPKLTRNLIESKLCTYRGFDPLLCLLEHTLCGVSKTPIRSCFGERAELPGQATKTTVLHVGQTLINWQTCSDAGRDHKKKELCGRAVALRYSWDSASGTFIPRPGVKKLILLVDGTWRQGDLDALVRAGWDEIFYPDQMDALKKGIE